MKKTTNQKQPSATDVSLSSEAHLRLTDEDATLRAELEAKVTAGDQSGITAAEALYEIYQASGGKLWKSEFTSFHEYCTRHWGYQKAHAYRILKFGGFVTDLKVSHPDVSLPSSESQVRSLLTLPDDKIIPCWLKVREEHPGKVTAEEVEQVVLTFKKPGSKSALAGTKRLLKAFEKLDSQIIGNPSYSLIRCHIESIRKILEKSIEEEISATNAASSLQPETGANSPDSEVEDGALSPTIEEATI